MLRRLCMTLLMLLATAAPAAAQSGFDGWASVIVAGDWRDGHGRPIPAFDNALRDLRAGFLAVGLPEERMVAASLRPNGSETRTADDVVADITRATRGSEACLLYFTSHGSPRGLVFGPDHVIAPGNMASLVTRWCGAKPTVVVVSACFAGVFVDPLAAPNRLVLTAARSDRSSFGCGAGITWPYFDGCVIEALRTTSDFVTLAQASQRCVARLENEQGLKPPSEPQLRVGTSVLAALPKLAHEDAEPAEVSGGPRVWVNPDNEPRP